MATDINLNQTMTLCLRTIRDIGSTTVQNICNGTTTTVPWGSADWAGALALSTIIGGLILIVLGFIVAGAVFMIGDWLRARQYRQYRKTHDDYGRPKNPSA